MESLSSLSGSGWEAVASGESSLAGAAGAAASTGGAGAGAAGFTVATGIISTSSDGRLMRDVLKADICAVVVDQNGAEAASEEEKGMRRWQCVGSRSSARERLQGNGSISGLRASPPQHRALSVSSLTAASSSSTL